MNNMLKYLSWGFFYRLLLIGVFAFIFFLVVAYARGYRFDPEKKSISPTGILAVSSQPKAAKIFINDQLKGITDMNITLPPGNYKVEIKKEGYTSWNKQIVLKGELVLTLDALLFPLNPSLSPLTNLGIIKAIPVYPTDRILLIRDNSDPETDGIYLFDAGKKPLSLFSPLKLLILKKNLPAGLEFADPISNFSPDYKQTVLEFKTGELTNSYLISLEDENQTAFDVTASKDTLLSAWNEKKQLNNLKILETYPKEITKIATDSFHIVSFSPNETKVLYRSKQTIVLPYVINPPLIATNQTKEERLLQKDSLYIYDKKEDKNFYIPYKPAASDENSVIWLPDSKHLAIKSGKKIEVVDYDGNNTQTIYSGPFESNFIALSSDGTLVIMANLNPEVNKYFDLYEVGIK